ncbi:hypothetical protein UK15_29935 [Streptomyces variegatus]|uniref:Acyl-CoA dehydrogenase/oxidase C-terminal domain-containing protein n=1 Tax=Streptomyces variegatus TaxID=284040 RepID=A0A0M2GJE9_9ACTN|nr:hypothetical protein UK15_29935 [Streptomyces variegatus]
MGVAPAPFGPGAEFGRPGPGHAHWLRVVRETAEDLATDAVARDQAGKPPAYEEHAEISVLVAMAEAAASRAAQESTARALDIIGAHSASARLGFDRFWRNARTHTLYEPVGPRLRDVGDYFLNGAHPPFVLPD